MSYLKAIPKQLVTNCKNMPSSSIDQTLPFEVVDFIYYICSKISSLPGPFHFRESFTIAGSIAAVHDYMDKICLCAVAIGFILSKANVQSILFVSLSCSELLKAFAPCLLDLKQPPGGGGGSEPWCGVYV